jgi:antitoxin FitA
MTRHDTPNLGVSHPIRYSDVVKTIQIRNVPDRVHKVLRARAAAAGMSLSDYALAELERVADRPPVADLLARARARAGGAGADAIVAAVRSGRDRS